MLVGNHYEVMQDGLLAVGKNALQRSGIKTISKQEFRKVTNSKGVTFLEKRLPVGIKSFLDFMENK